MNLEKGINRIGIVGGTVLGLFVGSHSMAFFCDMFRDTSWFDYLFRMKNTSLSQYRDVSQASWDAFFFLATIVVSVPGFFLTFFLVMCIAKAINWIILGFKEQE